jgi:hypothetical protein
VAAEYLILGEAAAGEADEEERPVGSVHRADSLRLAPARFLELLTDAGLDLAPAGAATTPDALPADDAAAHRVAPASPLPLVVLIVDDGEIEKARAAEVEGDRASRDIIPVSFLGRAAGLFEDLSQSIPAPTAESWELAAERVALIATVGGDRIVRWNRLSHDAEVWSEQSAAASLLQPAEVIEALALTQTLRSRAVDVGTRIPSFIDASSRAIARRRRRRSRIIGITAVALAALVVVASAQTISAVAAENASRTEAEISAAERLGATALDYVDRDPDMPSILAATAEDLARTTGVDDAVRTVASSTLPHESFPLPWVPRQVEAARDADRLAILSIQAPEALIFDTVTRSEVARIDIADASGDEGAASGRLSPDGTDLITLQGDELRVFSIRTGESRILEPTDEAAVAASGALVVDRLLGWLGDDLAVGVGDRVVVVDTGTGAASTIVQGEPGEFAVGFDVASDGERIAVSFESRVLVLDRDLAVTTTLDDQAVSDLAFSRDGESLFLAGATGRMVEFGDGPDDLSTFDYGYSPVSAEPIGDAFVAVGDRSGGLAVAASGFLRPAVQLRAHLSDAVRAAGLRDGVLATVGFDRYLRLWDFPSAADVGTAGPYGFMSQDQLLDSGTHQIRHTAGDEVSVMLVPSFGYSLHTDDGEPGALNYFGGMLSEATLTDDGRYIALVDSEKLVVYPFDDASGEWLRSPLVRWNGRAAGQTSQGLEPHAVTVSAGGDFSVVATTGEVRLWSTPEPDEPQSIDYESAERPLGAFVDDDGRFAVVTETGGWRRQPSDLLEPETDLMPLIRARAPDAALVSAAAVTAVDSAVIATDDGSILRISPDDAQQIAPPGTAVAATRVRISDDGSVVAVLSGAELVIVRAADGAELYRDGAVGALAVSDLSFEPGDPFAVTVVTGLGTVRTLRLDEGNAASSSPSSPLAGLLPGAGAAIGTPRLPTAAETDAFSLDEVVRGG